MELAHASVVHEDIQSPEARHSSLYNRGACFGIRDVARYGNELVVVGRTSFIDQCLILPGGLLIWEVVHCYVGALLEIFEGDGSSYACNSARDDRGLPGQESCHCGLICLVDVRRLSD